jgi:hypothetical protein
MPEIERHDSISKKIFLSEYRLPARPVVLTNIARRWRAVSAWSFAYLRECIGSTRVGVRPKMRYAGGLSMRGDEEEVEIALAQVLDYLESDNCPDLSYARQVPLFKLGRLRSDLARPPYVTEPAMNPELWIGPGGTVAQLHWDPAHNLFVQIRGRKRFILIAPEDADEAIPNQFGLSDLRSELARRPQLGSQFRRLEKALGPRQAKLGRQRLRAMLAEHLDTRQRRFLFNLLAGLNCYRFDVEDPDCANSPRCWHTTLNPGEMLFIPFMWLHHVRSLEPSISVNWFFHPTEHSHDHLRSVILDTLSLHLGWETNNGYAA